jgi:glyoxylase-like metal-dependent hydrolase (beta-lactamase superfamily II)
MDRAPRPRLRRILVGAGLFPLFVGAAWLSLTRGSVRRLPRRAWPVPPPSATSWQEVLARPPIVELYSLDTGEVHVARKKMLAQHHPLTAGYVEEPTPLHVFAHLIRHPTKGEILVDSGLDASFTTHAYGNIQWPTRSVLALLYQAPYTQAPGQDLAAQLARLEAHPRAVFLTHLHMDHTAGLPALDAATEIVTGAGEADDPVQLFGYGHLDRATHLDELDFTAAPELPPLGRALDLFGDGSVWAIATPGHTRGHVSFLVNAKGGPVLLTGDASHFRWAFEHDVGPSGTSGQDDAIAQATLDRLRAFAAAHPEVTVFTGHEAPRR